MAELEEKLGAILGNPEAMEQIVSIAKALTGEAGAATPQEPQHAPAAAPAQQPDWSGILGLLSGGERGAALGDLDPKLIQTALLLFSEYSATDDRKIALLTALKPFLKTERYAKVDKAVQIAKLSRVIRVAFQLFKKDGGEGDV